jgi:hypothetical protein
MTALVRPMAVRRTLTSLVMVLMALALITRALAAPVIHLHDVLAPETPVKVEPPGAAAHDDCPHDAQSAANADMGPDTAHKHGSDSPLSSHAKACDSSGACCGPLALSDTSGVELAAPFRPEPVRLLPSIGVTQGSPHRPPSPLLA